MDTDKEYIFIGGFACADMALYLDNAATTKVRKEVIEEMNSAMNDNYGNPSSQHSIGEMALKAINRAREKLAGEINAKQWEIIFTSGATEANNIAILGLAKANPGKRTIIVSELEHPSIIEPVNYLKSIGYRVVKIPVDKQGRILMEYLENELEKNRKDILVVSVIHANNIIGVIQDINKIGDMCRKNDVLFHTDAAQSFGKLKIDVSDGIDLLSASAHKIGGPKGIGLLYIREGIKIFPLVYGGGQEKGLRSGTENAPGVVGFAKALELEKKVDKEKIGKIRNSLIKKIGKIGRINGSLNERIYNNVHVSFTGVDSGVLVHYLSGREIYVSSGSACESKKKKEDYVLKAIGLDEKDILGSIRISLNDEIKSSDVDVIVDEIAKAVKKLRVK